MSLAAKISLICGERWVLTAPGEIKTLDGRLVAKGLDPCDAAVITTCHNLVSVEIDPVRIAQQAKERGCL